MVTSLAPVNWLRPTETKQATSPGKSPMFERLDQIEARYEELTNALASPDIVNERRIHEERQGA